MRLTVDHGWHYRRGLGVSTVVIPDGLNLFWDRNQRTLLVQNADGTLVAAFASCLGFHTEAVEVTTVYEGEPPHA